METDTPRSFGLDGAAVLFTGVGGSIGSAIRKRLDATGAKVIALSHQKHSEASLVTDFRNDEALLATLRRMPQSLDHVVLSHGLLEQGPWSEVPPDAWRQTLDVNLNSIYTILFAALPRLRKGASVVVISSTAAFDHSPVGGPHYTASKWALNGLVRHLANELGPSGIRINAVCPGLVENPMGWRFLDQESHARSLEEIPLRRGGEPDEVAAAVMFLLSKEASYVTGAQIPVSGGYQ